MAHLRSDDSLSDVTVARFERVMRQFVLFLGRGHGIGSLHDASGVLVNNFLRAPTADALVPSVGVQHFRRSTLRALFRSCRQLGLLVGDPTIDAVLPARPAAGFRPLTDDEVNLAHAVLVDGGRRDRAATAWALCEATARTGELLGVRHGDVDLASGRVWIRGTSRSMPRWGQLTLWGTAHLARATTSGADPDAVVLMARGGGLTPSSAVAAITRTLVRIGLGDAPDVRPASVAAWRGRAIFETSGAIEVAARGLGMRSLDQAARFIGLDWQDAV